MGPKGKEVRSVPRQKSTLGLLFAIIENLISDKYAKAMYKSLTLTRLFRHERTKPRKIMTTFLEFQFL